MAVFRWEVCEAIRSEQIIGVIRAAGPDEAVRLGEAMIAGGLRIVEVALTTPHGLEAIRQLASRDDDGRLAPFRDADREASRDASAEGLVELVHPPARFVEPGRVRTEVP